MTDQLPTTPSRTVPVQFGTRLVSGALSGGAIGLSGGGLAGGAIAGVLGAVLGTSVAAGSAVAWPPASGAIGPRRSSRMPWR